MTFKTMTFGNWQNFFIGIEVKSNLLIVKYLFAEKAECTSDDKDGQQAGFG